MEIPGYRIKRQIGSGGMASVYLAVHEALDREVALKVMTPSLASDETYCRRFLKEGRISAKLNHRHVLTVFDIGQHEDHYYMASEYVPGGTLRDRITAGISDAETVRVLDELAQGLAYAHAHGIIHRDVKPGNVLFRNDDSCVLGDFGIAKAVNSNTFATKLGTSLGTPYYMSPEQARGEGVDARTDLYSLGVVLHECLTGKPPFDAEDPFTVALMQINEPVPRLPEPHSRYQPVLDKLLAKDPARRYKDAEAFRQALRKLRSGESATGFTPPVWWPKAAVGVTAAALLALAIWALSGSDAPPNEPETDNPPVAVDVDEPGTSGAAGAVANVLATARSLVAAGRLLPPEDPNAFDTLQDALGQAPESQAVQIALREVANTVESQAEGLWRRGEVQQARSVVCRGRAAFPEREGLGYLAEQFGADCGSQGAAGARATPGTTADAGDEGPATSGSADRQRVAELIADADRYMAEDVLAFPAGENAMDKYLAVVAIDPGNDHALTRLRDIADIWADTAEYELERGRSDSALNTVRLGLRAQADHPRLLALRDRLVTE